MESSSNASTTAVDEDHLCQMLHLEETERSTEVLLKKMKDQLAGDAMRIGKTMKSSLIKGRARGDSSKFYDWHNKCIGVGSQIFKALRVPEMLIECVFEKNFLQLSKETELHHETKTRNHAHAASQGRFKFLLDVGCDNFGAAETNDHRCLCCGETILRNHASRRKIVGYAVDEKMTHWS